MIRSIVATFVAICTWSFALAAELAADALSGTGTALLQQSIDNR